MALSIPASALGILVWAVAKRNAGIALPNSPIARKYLSLPFFNNPNLRKAIGDKNKAAMTIRNAPTCVPVNKAVWSGLKSPRLMRINELPHVIANAIKVSQLRNVFKAVFLVCETKQIGCQGCKVYLLLLPLRESAMNQTLFNMKRYTFQFLLITAAAVMTAGCSNSVENIETDKNGEVNVTFTETAGDGAERYIATIAIEGMACEMMCGNKIAGTLNGLEGVKSTDIEFKGEGEINSAIVDYDHTLISEQEMIEAVNGLANGAYKVKSVNVTHYKVAESKLDDAVSEEDKVSSYTPSLNYQLPNIFSVFSRLF
jgi:copper chaperone CopZ